MDNSVNYSFPDRNLKVTTQAGRPVFGEFLQITIFSDGNHESLMTYCLQKIAEIEKVLDLADPNSQICKLLNFKGDDTSEMSYAVGEFIEEALNLSSISSSTFDLFRDGSEKQDLAILARGHIIDQAVNLITRQEPKIKGLIHLAEGIRFFNCSKNEIKIRTGFEAAQDTELLQSSISTTESGGAIFDTNSMTLYLQPLRHGSTGKKFYSALAHTCMNSNALIYLGMHAGTSVVQECIKALQGQLVVYDENGKPIEKYQ